MPLRDIDMLRQRVETIRFFRDQQIEIALDRTALDLVEIYLERSNRPKTKVPWYISQYKSIRYFFSPNQEFYITTQGVLIVRELLDFLKTCFGRFRNGPEVPLIAELRSIANQLEVVDFHKLSLADYQLRNLYYTETMRLLQLVYELDAMQAIAYASIRMHMQLPEYEDETTPSLEIHDLFHPFLENPVANDFILNSDKQVCFLTGANMAGKSTLMKAVGVSVYLAHIGLPVPAKTMKTSVLSGLITTINLSDDIHSGYSHYYSEVKRVKLVAEKISASGQMLVIFDELFRGTNVKDAYDASKRVIEAFSNSERNIFIVSTHIVEVAQALSADSNISFKCLHTKMEEGKPVFDYRVSSGISNDRIGLWILENEGVFELLT